MANIDLGNLTRYDGKIKEYAEDKYLSKNTANWQMTEKAGAVTCYPVPDTELEPIVDFSFKEVPPAEGNKGPDNPSTITGVSSIKVTGCGKNLCPNIVTDVWGSGIEVTKNTDGSLTFNGSTINKFYTYVYNIGSPNTKIWAPWLKKGGTYTFSMSGDNGGVIFEMYYTKNTGTFGGPSVYLNPGESVTYTLPTDRTGLILRYIINNNTVVSNCTVKVQIEEGSTVTTFESYNETDYTISLGNTYYGGSVNLATGLMTIKYHGIVFTGQENADSFTEAGEVNNSGIYRCCYNITDYLAPRGIIDAHCTHFNYSAASWYSENVLFYPSNNFINFFTTFPTKTDFINFLNTQYNNSTPVVVTYILANPYTVQLNPIQIKSLTALDKNTPRLNTLYTDADSIQVGYQKHPARTSYELENAILALGGGE